MESRVLEQKVHFFEHYSLEKFEEYFRGAFQYVTNIACDKLLTMVRLRYYKDEILLLVESLIQGYFLTRHNATYAEFFYNFHRTSTDTKHPTYPKITSKSKILALLLQTLTPYIRSKLDRYFNDIQAKIANYDILTEQEKQFRKIYPFVVAAFRLINFLVNAKYLLQPQFEWYSLEYLLAQHSLARQQPGDMGSQSSPSSHPMIEFIKKYFVFGLFLGFQALDWYYRVGTSRNNNNRNQSGSGHQGYSEQIPPPENKPSYTANNSRNALNVASFCKICRSKIKNPAALATSGQVFCFGCISDYVKNFKKCPITAAPSDDKAIIKLYMN